jgi:predicted dehydrogenase
MASGGVAFYEGNSMSPADVEARRWIDAVKNDTDPVVLPQQACVVSEILEAIYKSAETGQPVYFN